MEQNTKKMTLKIPFFKIPKNKKLRFFLMSQGSFSPKIRFLGQKVCSVARTQTDRHESEYRGHPFRVSGFFKFFFNLSSRSGPTTRMKCSNGFIAQSLSQRYIYNVMYLRSLNWLLVIFFFIVRYDSPRNGFENCIASQKICQVIW